MMNLRRLIDNPPTFSGGSGVRYLIALIPQGIQCHFYGTFTRNPLTFHIAGNTDYQQKSPPITYGDLRLVLSVHIR